MIVDLTAQRLVGKLLQGDIRMEVDVADEGLRIDRLARQ